MSDVWCVLRARFLFCFCRSRLDASATSLQDAPSSIVPVRPPPGEEPAKGFTWEDYEGVQVDDDASGEEDSSWGVVRSRRSECLSSPRRFKLASQTEITPPLALLQESTNPRRKEEKEHRLLRRSHSRRRKSSARMRREGKR
jgi:hypothetical protein